LILYLDNIIESWVLDSTASFQTTHHTKYFQSFVQGDFEQVYLGDDEPCQIVGMGKVEIKKKNGNQWLLKGAIYTRSEKKSNFNRTVSKRMMYIYVYI
jgi:hypothetical protein